MTKVIYRTLCSIVLILCCLLAVQAQLGDTVGDNASQADAEQRVVSSTSSLEELRKAIDELKSLIKVAKDIQDSIAKATVRHSRLLRRVHPELTTSADKDACPSGHCKAQHKRKTPQLPSKADMWKRPLFALCLGLVGYWHFTRLKSRRRAAALDAVRGNRDALEHDAALAAFGRESGRVPGEDEEFAAELREAMLEEERHLSSDHFRESLMENKWRPKGHAGRSTTKGIHQAVLRQRMAMPLPQESVPSQRETGGQAANLGGASLGPSQLASSLARLQQLEDSELRGPSPDMRQLLREKDPSDATAVSSVRTGIGSISSIHDTPASSAPDDSQKAERVPTSKAEQMPLLASQRHVADLDMGGNTRGVLKSSPPAPSA